MIDLANSQLVERAAKVLGPYWTYRGYSKAMIMKVKGLKANSYKGMAKANQASFYSQLKFYHSSFPVFSEVIKHPRVLLR